MQSYYKTVYLYDPVTLAVVGPYNAQESPEEPGKFITPDSHVDIPIPDFDPARQTCTLDPSKSGWRVQLIA